MSEGREIVHLLESYLGLALVVGVPVAAARLSWRPPAEEPLPEPPVARWGAVELIAVVLIYQMVGPAIAYQILASTGFFSWWYGPDFLPQPLPKGQQPPFLALLWASVVALPFALTAILAVLRFLNDTRPAQIGLSLRRWPADAWRGYRTWLLLTPVVFLVHQVALWVYIVATGASPSVHPLQQALQGPAGSAEWVLMVLQASMAAPLFEELFFRGLVQRWTAARPWGPAVVLGLALVVALFQHPTLAAVLCVLALLPAYAGLEWLDRRRTREAQSILGTAALFAAFHASVWPTPVPLFLLGLGLGWLARRTGGLLAPMLAHSLFNAVSCGGLWLDKVVP